MATSRPPKSSPRSRRGQGRHAPIDHPDVVVTIERFVPGGIGLARDDDGVVFISGALPGEKVRAAVDKKRGGVRHGHAVERLVESPDRIAPDCAVHPRCGGCDLLDLAPPARLVVKEDLVRDVLRRVARLDDASVQGAIAPLRRPSTTASGLRRRARVHVGETQTLGFFAPKSHQIVDTDRCAALVPALHPVWRAVRTGGLIPGTSVEFLATPSGEVYLSSSPDNEEALAKIVEDGIAAGACAYGESDDATEHVREYSEADFFAGERGGADVIAPFSHGGPYLVDAATFAQASEFGAATIAEEVLFAAFAPEDDLGPSAAALPLAKEIAAGTFRAPPTTRVLELFAGAGHLSFPLASAGVHVTAVEGAPISSAWLAANAEAFASSEPPGAGHVTPVSAYISPDNLTAEIKRECDAQILVADPPRTGIPNAEALFAASSATRLVLVSCDLATGARDLRKAIDAGFALKRLVPIDAFGRTSHLEWVATLIRPPRAAPTFAMASEDDADDDSDFEDEGDEGDEGDA